MCVVLVALVGSVVAMSGALARRSLPVSLAVVGSVLAIGVAGAGEVLGPIPNTYGCKLDGLELVVQAGAETTVPDGSRFRVVKAESHFTRLRSPKVNDFKGNGYILVLIKGPAGRFILNQAYMGFGGVPTRASSRVATAKDIARIDASKRARKAERINFDGRFFGVSGPLNDAMLTPVKCK